MGLSYSDLMCMTLEEWELWCKGYSMRLEDEWRQTRELMAMIHNCAFGIKKAISAKDLIQLPSEKESKEVTVPTLDERFRIAEKYKAMKKNKKLSATEFLKAVR